jgi:hypothetical protein
MQLGFRVRLIRVVLGLLRNPGDLVRARVSTSLEMLF